MWYWGHYRTVAAHFLEQGYTVALLGGPADHQVNQRVAENLDVVDLAGKTTVAEAMAIVQNARIMICNDSMALHLASAFRIPCVAIFCATCPSFGFGPWQNPRAVVVENKAWPVNPAPGMAAKPAPPARVPVWKRCCRKKYWRLQTRF